MITIGNAHGVIEKTLTFKNMGTITPIVNARRRIITTIAINPLALIIPFNFKIKKLLILASSAARIYISSVYQNLNTLKPTFSNTASAGGL
jgi:hypothetical protein